ncbi:cytochrome c [Aquamicrobium defluvii]|uniref:Cytochrome C n=1 Tax=Aquamicrobium defluvii TaxID=69279 RepID=A0A011VNZ3_9HYPH|nr:cytochrome c [Aquamicrobium defluvii]EXL10090.1 cytochrome C [Aquamicrobium defluvii]EZQ16866.1 cytochrome C [Halopseudomonas bauzanensis]TDR36412.1 mono/diheme cytochrome c family protein [Aquamicrobium defluvii]
MSRVGKVGAIFGLVIAAGSAAGWFLSAPQRPDQRIMTTAEPGNAERGLRIFHAGGCASCHAAKGAEGEARFQLAGGVELRTPFGTFVAPNISQDASDGIGNWTLDDFAAAMLKGVSPDGRHYYPAFPYTSYARMKPQDIADLFAFMQTLPAVAGQTAGHDLAFPFNVRRGIGLWKLLYMSDRPVVEIADASDKVLAGRYLVEGPGHCGECHTPRDFAGGPDTGRWLAGAVAAEGDGVVPNITAGEGGIADWSEADIAGYLETGFTPDFDSVGGSMAEVQRNMAELTSEDREAIAAYLKAIPAHPNGYPARRP